MIAVLGVGPGLGLSIARRFGREGHDVALVSRSDTRHETYRAGLAAAGVKSRTYAADLTDPAALRDVVARIADDLGPLDTVYFGPAVAGSRGIVPLPAADADDVREPLENLLTPAVHLVSAVLPAMLDRGEGTLLFPSGLSGLHPMPMLGNLAPASAALRMYVLTLHAALADRGVYVGALTIGGLVIGGDIHRMLTEQGHQLPTLDPDAIAETAWRMAVERTDPEAVFDAIHQQ
ncbi:short-chain dehydrogenase [Actinoplanes sp. ATCC 53533]|uniref:SDR family NAD(P)-dependent oxidoreductase n=1 Tax=Actinoplanes sp. ATCC 53533 TaxID=1288362 RepID=UPI000F7819C8|nr:SDR family NAD(P)-dependent oxidoreductase [Actinoplanes sp. ATCC 53533]RSM72590.1 short-chain dehydrogenase [Actinoplanes sp. ATCC 53533]